MSWLVAALVAPAVVVAGHEAQAERAGTPSAWTEHLDEQRCGVVNTDLLPPRVMAHGDVDGDGRVEHFVANYGGVEQVAEQEGSVPPVMVRVATVLTSSAANQYSCVDLQLLDLDRDGDLDMIFASHRELAVLTNRGGRFSVTTREPQSLDGTVPVRAAVVGRRIIVRSVGGGG